MRRSERIAVDAPARLQPNEWSAVEVRLLDCSLDGWQVDPDRHVTACCGSTETMLSTFKEVGVATVPGSSAPVGEKRIREISGERGVVIACSMAGFDRSGRIAFRETQVDPVGDSEAVIAGSGVSLSEIWTSEAASPRALARSAIHRVMKVLPAPY